MAGTSPHYPCPNIPPSLRVKTLDEFKADRELDKPIDLLYLYTKETNNLNGVLATIYTLGKVLAVIEKKLGN
jgi:hypothetical protein